MLCNRCGIPIFRSSRYGTEYCSTCADLSVSNKCVCGKEKNEGLWICDTCYQGRCYKCHKVIDREMHLTPKNMFDRSCLCNDCREPWEFER